MDDECRWKETTQGFWRSGCLKIFWFEDGSPSENGFVFCPFCRSLLVEIPFDDDYDDDYDDDDD